MHSERRQNLATNTSFGKETLMLWKNRGIVASFVLAICGAVLISGQNSGVRAADRDPSKPGAALDTKDISLDQAHAIVAAAVAKAAELKTKMDIAVVDA